MADIYFSFFMFTANLQPEDRAYTQTLVTHMKAPLEMGYTGFDMPVAPGATTDHAPEVESYKALRQTFDDGVIFMPCPVSATERPASSPGHLATAQCGVGKRLGRSPTPHWS